MQGSVTDYGLEVIIREKREYDSQACLDLLMLVHQHDQYPLLLEPQEVRAFFSVEQETAAWVAERGRHVVGHVALHWDAVDPTLAAARAATGLVADQVVLLARLFVSPDSRGTGLGRLLLRHADGHARSLGKRAVLDVGQALLPAIALYESEGWLRVADLHPPIDAARTLDLWVYVSPEAEPADHLPRAIATGVLPATAARPRGSAE